MEKLCVELHLASEVASIEVETLSHGTLLAVLLVKCNVLGDRMELESATSRKDTLALDASR